MQGDKDIPNVPSEADQNFTGFLKQVRKEEKVLLEQLSEGLMTTSQLARIEKGQRSVGKNMRDRLLGRLGISSDLYENLLNIEDYAAWEQQRDILGAIEGKAFQRAQELLEVFERQQPDADRDKIKQQFCLVMRAEILRQQGADQCVIGGCYEKAVELTVLDEEHLLVSRKLLSIQEVNMILEHEFYRKGDDFAKKCRELMVFVENAAYDDLSKAKIYPKIVYYYLREISARQGGWSMCGQGEALEICNKAIEMLRDAGCAYFLLELLEIKIEIMECIGNEPQEYGRGMEKDELRAVIQESAELADLLKGLYAEYGVPAYMQDCAYLYQQRWVFYIGDVLRIRRTMYGLTQQQLCGDDCSVRTLRRAERREANMQYDALCVLLGKLGLSKDFQRVRLALTDSEALRLMGMISVSRNNRDPEQARTVLDQMKEKGLHEIPENRQYFMEADASLEWMMGRITKEEFASREQEVLECTLKVKDLYHMDEVYLTEMEMLAICKRMQVLPEAEKEQWIDFLVHLFDGYEKRNALADCISIYDFSIIHIICELGNLKEYERSVNLAKKVLKADLECRRIWGIDALFYEIMWNGNKKMTESLRQCIILSHFCKRTFYEDFYCKKLHQL